FGGAAGEDDFPETRAYQLRHLLARAFHRLGGLPAEGMIPAGGIAEVLAEKRQHRVEHARIDGSGGVRVEVDHRLFPASSFQFPVFSLQPNPRLATGSWQPITENSMCAGAGCFGRS